MNLEAYKLDFEKENISKEAALCSDIYEFYGRKIHYPLLLKLIKEKGYQATFQIWGEVKDSRAHTPHKLFMWKMMKEKVLFKEEKKLFT